MQPRVLALILAGLVAMSGCGDAAGSSAPTRPTVFAATSLTNVMPAIDRDATYAFGGSNALQMQIERGAPADLFLAAGPKEARALYREGRCERPVTFATNRLVLVVRRGDPSRIRTVGGLRRGGLRLSVGSAGVPVGDYTRTLLARLRLSGVLRANRVSEQANAGQVLSQVAFGGADAGFVYVTDARAQAGRVRAVALPRRAQPPVRYQACVVRRPGVRRGAARALLGELRSAPGRATLRRHGFGLPAAG